MDLSVNNISYIVTPVDTYSLIRNKQFCTVWRSSRKEGVMDEAKLPPEITHLISFNNNHDDTRIGYGLISFYNENKKDQIVVLERLDIFSLYQNQIHLFYSILRNNLF